MRCSNTIHKSSGLTKWAIKFAASYLAMTAAFGHSLGLSVVVTILPAASEAKLPRAK